jgi:hypothetical protein
MCICVYVYVFNPSLCYTYTPIHLYTCTLIEEWFLEDVDVTEVHVCDTGPYPEYEHAQVCMYVCMFMCIILCVLCVLNPPFLCHMLHINIHTHTHTHTHTQTHTHTHIPIHTHTRTHTYTHTDGCGGPAERPQPRTDALRRCAVRCTELSTGKHIYFIYCIICIIFILFIKCITPLLPVYTPNNP